MDTPNNLSESHRHCPWIKDARHSPGHRRSLSTWGWTLAWNCWRPRPPRGVSTQRPLYLSHRRKPGRAAERGPHWPQSWPATPTLRLQLRFLQRQELSGCRLHEVGCSLASPESPPGLPSPASGSGLSLCHPRQGPCGQPPTFRTVIPTGASAVSGHELGRQDRNGWLAGGREGRLPEISSNKPLRPFSPPKNPHKKPKPDSKECMLYNSIYTGSLIGRTNL